MSKVYTFVYDDYREAIRALRELRGRGVGLVVAVVVVRVDHHNKVKDFISMMKEKQRDPLAPQILLLQLQRIAP